MVLSWFWSEKNKKDDPAKSLDPSLKEFLNQQRPRPYVTADAPQSTPVQEPAKEPQQPPDTNRVIEDRPLPRESLFQDGRYKDLWKTYTPQDEITTSIASPLDRILTARKDRKEMVHRAALENCAFEQEIKDTCFDTGNAAARARARLTMCREETKAFNRCYQLQAKFLQSLGYLTSSNATDEEEERIQMHADKLYHRMMDYEASVADAKQHGEPIPPLSSVFNPSQPAPSLEQLNLPRSMEKQMKKPLKELMPHERELAVRAALQEAKMTHLYAREFQEFASEMDGKRRERQAWMTKTFGEPIGKFIIPDPPQASEVKPYKLDDLERGIWREGNDPVTAEVEETLKSDQNRKTG